LNIKLENVNLKSNSGPNYFARKLVDYLMMKGVTFNDKISYDVKLAFIESFAAKDNTPMVQRLDGIYFNSNFNCKQMNYNIQKTYENSNGVIFQTHFNKELTFNWFGKHSNYTVINNGYDKIKLLNFKFNKSISENFKNYDNIWACAASWHPYKRLKENINFFIDHAGENDCLLVCGSSVDYTVEQDNIYYLGNLNLDDLYTVYEISKYFLHLAYLDHCPNVVVDAKAKGCQIICSSSGGTKEIAGLDATIVLEDDWDFSFINNSAPPPLDFTQQTNNNHESSQSMSKTTKLYQEFLRKTIKGGE